MNKTGTLARIASELNDIRREMSKKNNIKLCDADREIAKMVRNVRGKYRSVKEITF